MAVGIGGVMVALGSAGDGLSGWHLAPGLLICGIGMGMGMGMGMGAVLRDRARRGRPAVDGIGVRCVLSADQQLGSAAGVAVLGTVFFGLLESGAPLAAVQAVLATTIGISVLTAALAFVLHRERVRRACGPATTSRWPGRRRR